MNPGTREEGEEVMEKLKQVELTQQDCEKLTSMLNVHVRPVYFKAANRKDRKGADHSAERALATPMLADCDRLADLFQSAASS